MREFETGATRDLDDGKHDYEGFLSPLVLREFGRYMHQHRIQADGQMRDSDNWQKGIPRDTYMKSGFRHFMDWWSLHRGLLTRDFSGKPVDLKDALTAVLFNAMGYLHEILEDEQKTVNAFSDALLAIDTRQALVPDPARTCARCTPCRGRRTPGPRSG
jgi:hypothetical protein